MSAAFEFDHVSVISGTTTILDDVTATVPSGAVTVVRGPSGAGKSTLLRLCNRLEVPTRGAVRYGGDDVAGLDPLQLRRRVGMVFQQPTLFGGTVRDNLHVALPKGTDEQFCEALHLAGLPSTFLDRVGDVLSGGEAQRACLARTLVTGPDVLLMDEPTSSLDDSNVSVLEEHTCALTERGVTVVWVTHDGAQTGRIADHVIELEAGRIVE